PRFQGLSRIAQHRLVYDALADLMVDEIHAVSVEVVGK
ncbi:MAG: BolA/IbaG family iron-sulfur metabolism protein, partial [Pirellulaceae bacterium]|nr:BolA/IbaG family iron-sulfur metabolism protein [Pirellulaceae bacterium]